MEDNLIKNNAPNCIKTKNIIFSKMEDNLNFFLNGRQPYLQKKNEHVRQLNFFKMGEDLNFF